ncbi:MAG: RnfABCDGE type electron transport complex subunit D [Pseudomonadota bacterium]
MDKNIQSLRLQVGPSPHVVGEDSVPKIMWTVVAALIPALVVATANFGWYSLLVVGLSVMSAVATEAIIVYLRSPEADHLSTITDGSAFLTGMLLAFTLPPNVPLYLPVIGSAFAIGIAKHAFGGLGCNIWNPALAGRAFLLAAYSNYIVMTKWPILPQLFSGNITGVDAVSAATPCALLHSAPLSFFNNYSIMDIFFGRIPGSIGETSAFALILGGLYLIYKGYVNWRMPASYILTVAAFVILFPIRGVGGELLWFWDAASWTCANPLYLRVLAQIFSGGLMLGAFFMATDMVTSPLTGKGQVIFGIGCGILVGVIRYYGGYPEGVCYSILIMNTVVWLIDKYTSPKLFGEVKNA